MSQKNINRIDCKDSQIFAHTYDIPARSAVSSNSPPSHSNTLTLWASSFALLVGLVVPSVACVDDPDNATEGDTSSESSTPQTSSSFLECVNSRPHGDPSEDLEICDNGLIHRVGFEPGAFCEDTHVVRTPDPNEECPYYEYPDSNCRYNSDCMGGVGGICSISQTNILPREFADNLCQCSYQRIPDCETNADCGDQNICVCGEDGGYCQNIGAQCRNDSDCEGDLLCRRGSYYTIGNPCIPGSGGQYFGFNCQTQGDSCITDEDCPVDHTCGFDSEEGRHACIPFRDNSGGGCPGRPFIIDDEFRLAEVEEREDWSSECSPTLHTSEDAREAAAKHWTEAGLMEHASIAAFARFAMQLMSLGASPDLIEATTQAMQDETHHAKDCFALASHFAGKPVGPGPLAIENALDDSNDLLNIIALTIHEGCIGETVAALEAVDALQYTKDPTIQSVLGRIARDERQHAALAWNFIRWVLRIHPHMYGEIQALFFQIIEHERQSVRLDIYETEQDLRHLGVLSASQSRSLKRRVLDSIITPLAQSLFREPKPCSSSRLSV